MNDRPTASTITDAKLDALYQRLAKQSRLLQELKRDNFALRMDLAALLEDKTVSQIQPGEISATRRNR